MATIVVCDKCGRSQVKGTYPTVPVYSVRVEVSGAADAVIRDTDLCERCYRDVLDAVRDAMKAK